MSFRALYTDLKKDEKVGRWYGNLQRGSLITGDVYLRTLGLYCKENNTTPEEILKDARSGKLRDDFMDLIDVLEKKGRMGSYITRFKKMLNSWCRFNKVNADLKGLKISEAGIAKTLANETSPTQEEVNAILRNASIKGRAIISLLAFSGLDR